MLNLQEATWTDVQDALKKTDLAIIPIGAVEVYGPHMPQGTDGIVAFYFANKLAKRVNGLLVPLIPVGISPESLSFPGTLSVQPESLKAYLRDIAFSLVKHGVKRIVFLTGHRTNFPPMEDLLVELRDKDIKAVAIFTWQVMYALSSDLAAGEYAQGHAGEFGVSVMLAVREELVHRERFHSNKPKTNLGSGIPGISIYQRFTDMTDDGIVGNPDLGTKEKGEELLHRGLDQVEKFIKSW